MLTQALALDEDHASCLSCRAAAASNDPIRALAVLVVTASGSKRSPACGWRYWTRPARLPTGVRQSCTNGRPTIMEIRTSEGFAENDVLRLAASLDQTSAHVVATSLVQAAAKAG